MNTFGTDFRVTVFGESHGPCVGCVIDGIPAGFTPDFDLIRSDLLRRAPHDFWGTDRREPDEFEILSGLYEGKTCGSPLTVIFRNRDQRPHDYSSYFARPSHADLTAYVKYAGHNDPRGGGQFSGRLTLPLVFCGALAKQMLAKRGILIGSHVYSIADVCDDPFDPVEASLPELDSSFPLLNAAKKAVLFKLLEQAKTDRDSVGCVAECKVVDLPIGVGEPLFDGLESNMSHILFSIPGVHGVEFGDGFGIARMCGSEANDAILRDMRTKTNRSGGINGGLSNGMPLIFRVAFRPVPSIGIEQRTIDLQSGEEAAFTVSGRHDVCILPRGLVVVEAAAAIAILDLLIRNGNSRYD